MIFKAKSYTLNTDKRACVMAVINLTPDSFFADSRVTGDKAVETAVNAVKNGADVIDLGAQSTAPDSKAITAEEELDRLIKPLSKIRKAVDVPISVDTFFPQVAEEALKNGADIINDVSGEASADMATLAAKSSAGWIVMHTGLLKSNETGRYQNGVISDINLFFEKAVQACEAAGLDLTQLCLDPGIGFGKSREDDLEIISHFNQFNRFGCVTLAALSRKRVTRLCGDALTGTITANTACILGGAGIIRVHDVSESAAQVRMLELLKGEKQFG